MILQIRVKPNAKTSALSQDEAGNWQAQLKSAPVDGKANKELISLLATQFGCQKSAIHIKAGASGRSKLVTLDI